MYSSRYINHQIKGKSSVFFAPFEHEPFQSLNNYNSICLSIVIYHNLLNKINMLIKY